MLIRWPSGLGSSVVPSRLRPARPPTCLHLAFEEDLGGDGIGRGHAARFGFGAGRIDLPFGLALEPVPLLLADLKLRAMRLQFRQRVARPFGRDLGFALVALGVLEAVPFKPRHGDSQQNRRALGADVARPLR